ncbi:MAG: plasmid replication initiator protein, partial [Pseudomonadota bacterium]
DTLQYLRTHFNGWDFYALHAEFEQWVEANQDRTPANWQRAFIGWVRRHHDKNKHQLRGY